MALISAKEFWLDWFGKTTKSQWNYGQYLALQNKTFDLKQFWELEDIPKATKKTPEENAYKGIFKKQPLSRTIDSQFECLSNLTR